MGALLRVRDLLIVERNNKFSKFYPNRVTKSDHEPMHRKFVKINKALIEKKYPNLSKELIKALENYRGDILLKKNIAVGELVVPINEEFLETYENYDHYSLISKNRFFSILIQRSSN